MSEVRAACYGSDEWPTVSVVMPIRNEVADLEAAVASILSQEYPLAFDVCLAVAPSTDGTEEIAHGIAAVEPRVSVVPNPAGITPAGLNAAIGATSGSVIVRVDGHAQLSPGYVRRAVETMRRTGAVNVGGMQVPAPETPFEEAVAAATTSWLGTGGASYRVGGIEGPVDTVYLGVFDRAAGDAVGWFDESLIRNQDYELNIRLRNAGGEVWFDPELAVGYRPRGSLRSLAKQYYEYGYWKAEVLRRHPESLRVRQAIPAAAPAVLLGSLLAARRRPVLVVIPGLYAALVTAESVRASRATGVGSPTLATVFPAMQLSWGVGFSRGAISRKPRPVPRTAPTDPDRPRLTIGYSTLAERAADIELPAPRTDTEIVIAVQGGGGKPPTRSDVRVVRLDSIGVAASRNAVIGEANGEFLLFADDDTRIDVDGAMGMVEHLDRHPDLTLVHGRIVDDRGDPRKRYPRRRTRLTKWNAAKVGTCELMVRTAAIEAAGVRFDENFGAGTPNYIGDEYIFVTDAGRVGLRGEFVPITVAVHSAASSGTAFAGSDDTRARSAVFDRVFGRGAVVARALFVARSPSRFQSVVVGAQFVRGGVRP